MGLARRGRTAFSLCSDGTPPSTFFLRRETRAGPPLQRTEDNLGLCGRRLPDRAPASRRRPGEGDRKHGYVENSFLPFFPQFARASRSAPRATTCKSCWCKQARLFGFSRRSTYFAVLTAFFPSPSGSGIPPPSIRGTAADSDGEEGEILVKAGDDPAPMTVREEAPRDGGKRRHRDESRSGSRDQKLKRAVNPNLLDPVNPKL